jgi:hypothetical protein
MHRDNARKRMIWAVCVLILSLVAASILKGGQTTEIDFQEVQFKSVPQKCWLPHDVTVTLDWAGHHLHNHHQYAEFRVFNAEENHKAAPPAGEKLSSSGRPGM